MARPPRRKKEILRAVARLYDDRRVDTEISQWKLIRAIVDLECPWDAESLKVQSRESTYKAISRARRLHQMPELWQYLLECAQLAIGADDHVPLRDVRRLTVELRDADPIFARVNDDLKSALAADSAGERLPHLWAAARALQRAFPGPASVRHADTQRKRLERAGSAWADVFDGAVVWHELTDDAVQLIELAIIQGHTYQQAARSLRTGRMAVGWVDEEVPTKVDFSWGNSGHWIAATAVFQVLAGASPEQVVERTRDWAVERLNVAPSDIDGGAVLTQAGGLCYGRDGVISPAQQPRQHGGPPVRRRRRPSCWR